MTLGLPLLLGFVLVLARTSALIVTAPIVSSRSVAPRLKVALTTVVAAVAWLGASTPTTLVPESPGGLIGLVLAELALGAGAGLSARVLFEAAQAGGQAAAMAMGFGYGALVDPHSGADSSVVGELVGALALAAALTLGLHREAIVWLATSVREVPPGSAVDVSVLARGLAVQLVAGAGLAVRVALPLLAAALLANVSLGLLGRAAPQLSLSNVGFALTITIGVAALYAFAPTAAHACARAATATFSR